MLTDNQLQATLLREIESSLNWGAAKQWTNTDFQELSQRVADTTEITLSPTTLKRVWGRVAYTSQPSTTTLDALAQFGGYEHWRSFRASHLTGEEIKLKEILGRSEPSPGTAKSKPRYWIVIGAFMMVLIVSFFYQTFDKTTATPAKQQTTLDPADYHFSVHPVTSGVPNSVVFKYDASAAPYDSVFLQQSWDANRREQIPRAGNTHTSIYYLPGFYMTKLVVGNQVVQERELLITSEDWVAVVATNKVPVYLSIDEVRKENELRISPDQLTKLGIPMQPQTPTTVLTQVGDYGGITTDNFNFTTRFQHDYQTGSAACQYAQIYLLLRNSAIIIPFSRPGCVADLSLFAGGKTYDGQSTDLSAFGVINDTCLELRCVGKGDLLTIYINDQNVFQVESSDPAREIIGVRYIFEGTGWVGEARLSNGEREVVLQ